MTARGRISIVLGLALVLVLTSVGVGWWWMAVGRHPLRGTLRHDFGEVPVGVGSSSFDYTFELVNATGAALVIQDIVEGCGCADAEPSTRNLEPGAPLTIDVTLRLSRAGEKNTYIDVLIADHGPQRLWLHATGVRALAIDVANLVVRLEPDQPVPYRLFADVQGSDAEPPAPKVAAGDHLDVRFVRWELIKRADPARRTPNRWAGIFEVRAGDAPLPDNAFFFVTVADQDPIRVRVRPPALAAPADAPTEAHRLDGG